MSLSNDDVLRVLESAMFGLASQVQNLKDGNDPDFPAITSVVGQLLSIGMAKRYGDSRKRSEDVVHEDTLARKREVPRDSYTGQEFLDDESSKPKIADINRPRSLFRLQASNATSAWVASRNDDETHWTLRREKPVSMPKLGVTEYVIEFKGIEDETHARHALRRAAAHDRTIVNNYKVIDDGFAAGDTDRVDAARERVTKLIMEG